VTLATVVRRRMAHHRAAPPQRNQPRRGTPVVKVDTVATGGKRRSQRAVARPTGSVVSLPVRRTRIRRAS
jgi:hypothetical protein